MTTCDERIADKQCGLKAGHSGRHQWRARYGKDTVTAEWLMTSTAWQLRLPWWKRLRRWANEPVLSRWYYLPVVAVWIDAVSAFLRWLR